jgi:hypothetical protein
MQLSTSALIPTIVIISLLAFFIGLVIAVAYHRYRQNRIRQIRRERRLQRSSHSIKKLTIEKGRVVPHLEDTSPITPHVQTFPRHGFWSVRTVARSSSASPSTDFSSWAGGLDLEKRGGTYYHDRLPRPNIDSVFDGADMAERGLFATPKDASTTDRPTFLTIPALPHLPESRRSVLHKKNNSPDIRIDNNGYSNGVRIVPLTTQSSPPSPTALRRPRTPSGLGSIGRASAGTSLVGLPGFRIPSLNRRQAVVFPEPASIDEVMDCLENAPRRPIRAGLLRGPLAARPAFSLTAPSPEIDQNEKALPDLPSFDSQIPPSLLPALPLRRVASPRPIERAKSMLGTIPGSPPESPTHAPSGGDDASTITSSPKRPRSYSGSQKSRLSTLLTHRLSLASLGPDFSGFRKSLAPSIKSSPSRPNSPVRSIHPASPAGPTLLAHPSSPSHSRSPTRSKSHSKTAISIPEDSAQSAQSSPILPREFPDVPPRGLSAMSAKSFATLSSVSAGEVYTLAKAMPVLHQGPAGPASVPISPVTATDSTLSTKAARPTSQGDSSPPPPLPPPIPPRAYRPAPPSTHRLSHPTAGTGPRNTFLIGKRKELVHPSRRSRPPTRKVTPPAPPPLVIGVEKEHTGTARLLKTPLSPMSVRTAEELQRERGKSWSGSEWEGNESSRSVAEGKKPANRSREDSPAVFL